MKEEQVSFLLDASRSSVRTPTLADQLAFLVQSHLDNEEGLSQLLDEAMKLARSQPDQARQLTILCAQVAEKANAPAIVPRANYFRAQTHAASGEFDLARQLIQEARAGYEALGDQLAALRTNIGLMHVLSELGHYEQVLVTGDEVLKQVNHDEPRQMMFAAFAHQNKGACYEKMARYLEALSSYAAAEALFVTLNMPERIGDISNNRGIVLMYLGRVSEALVAFESAATIRREANLTLLLAQTTSNIGEAYLMQGHYTSALAAFRETDSLFDELSAQAHQFIARRRTADAYLVLNLYAEALAAYQEAIQFLSDAGMCNHLARALWGMGSTLIGQSRLIEAEKVLAEALPLLSDNAPLLCSVMLEQAAAQNARGERALALETAQKALDAISNHFPVERIYALMRVADLLLPDTIKAEPYLLQALKLADSLALPPIGYRIKQRLGKLRLLQGRLPEAEAHLSAAITQISDLRGTLAQEALRTSFLQDKITAYEDLMQVHLARADEVSAFAVAEQAKSRTLVDLLTGVIKPPKDKEQPQLERLQADLNAVYNQFLAPNPRAPSQQELLQSASELEQKIGRLRLSAQESERDPFGTSFDPQTLQKHLPDEITLLVYHTIEDEINAFVVQKGQIQAVRHLSQAATIQNHLFRLETQWDRFRAGRRFAERHIKMLERSTQRILAALYNELVAPLESLIKPSKKESKGSPVAKPVVIVPHGVLHQVPFHALYNNEGQYLIDGWEISYAPSATIFALCQQRERHHKSGLVVGVPDPLIPAVHSETEAVANTLNALNPTRLHAEQATISALREASPNCDLLHLACHGLFRTDNPMFSALKLTDGWLTAADVMQLDLTNTTVVLSACESGRGTQKGDEIIGLPRAFLGAGASTLVVTLWLVQDETTAILMKQWYEQLTTTGTTPAAALRAAQLALKADYPHPYYWAPFILIGKRY